MATTSPEVRNGDFLYRDTLFVDLGLNKRHPRAAVQDLKELLLPKKGGSASAPPKDQVAHWYEAQLIHYGLPRSRDKNTAKVRLTNALASKTLGVPKDIVALEGEMKREYASALRRTKSGAGGAIKGEMKVAEGKAAKKSTTASTGTSKSKTTVALEVGGTKVTIDREDMEAAKKRSTASKAAASKPKGAKASDSKPKPATASTAATPKTKDAKASDANPRLATGAGIAADASRSQSQAIKRTARRGGHSAHSVSDRLVPSSSPEKPRAKQTARRGKDDPFRRSNSDRGAPTSSHTYDHTPFSFQHDVDMDDAPPAYEPIDFHQQRESPGPEDDFPISGTYFFPRAPFQPFSLTLQVDDRSRQLWGRFQIGSKEGVLCVGDMSGISSDHAVSFGWRSEDQDDGFMKFGRGCDGAIEFDGEGWIRGHFNGLMYGEDVEFVGEWVNGEGLDVREMKHIWEDFPRKAYGSG
ncbi:hypothetical protein A1O7_06897 [Cladophialophora yegresii CBS 114405]|uniref:Uncharacterized protein n=1 Tax=Cladophialophora yegresii CBS 114405 TaxID=1182544 RepID=W9VM11_9EURO|nr:uncharacterized protein A1O7_06897 [Cladophialophora yegresii CBS 114405]EXJ56553.1 hypothetical protein A1O7_06897 [Cladophialophora yegresii CBS 114405]